MSSRQGRTIRSVADQREEGSGNVPEQKEGKAAPSEEPRTYQRDRLMAEAPILFGEPHFVVEAALSTGTLARKQNFTIDEVKDAVKAYNEHEVEMEHGATGEEG